MTNEGAYKHCIEKMSQKEPVWEPYFLKAVEHQKQLNFEARKIVEQCSMDLTLTLLKIKHRVGT